MIFQNQKKHNWFWKGVNKWNSTSRYSFRVKLKSSKFLIYPSSKIIICAKDSSSLWISSKNYDGVLADEISQLPRNRLCRDWTAKKKKKDRQHLNVRSTLTKHIHIFFQNLILFKSHSKFTSKTKLLYNDLRQSKKATRQWCFYLEKSMFPFFPSHSKL